jgi:hypothetical protein
MDKRFRDIAVLVFVFIGFQFTSFSQDFISWSSPQLVHKIDKEFSVFLKPIVRHNLSQSRYLNWSPDYAISITADKNWSMTLLGRTWIIPNGPNRQFIFMDIKHKFSRAKFGIANILRVHHAFDIERVDADFLRWQPTIKYNLSSKFKPLIGAHVFYELNGIREINRVRYNAGFTFDFSKHLGLGFQYWREVFYNRGAGNLNNILVTNLAYKI